MKILEHNGFKYSREEFEGYAFRGIFRLTLSEGETVNVDIYTTNPNKTNVLEILRKRQIKTILNIEIFRWVSKSQDDHLSEIIHNL